MVRLKGEKVVLCVWVSGGGTKISSQKASLTHSQNKKVLTPGLHSQLSQCINPYHNTKRPSFTYKQPKEDSTLTTKPLISQHKLNMNQYSMIYPKTLRKRNLTFFYLSIKTQQDNHQLNLVFQRLTPISNQVTKHTIFIHALKFTTQNHQLYLIFQRRP